MTYQALDTDEEAHRLASAEWADLFDEVAPTTVDSARLLLRACEKRLPYLHRRARIDGVPAAERIAPLVREVEDEAIRSEAFEAAFDELAIESDRDVGLILAQFRRGEDDAELLEERLAVVRELQRRDGQEDAAFLARAMGEVMPYVLGRLGPDAVRDAVTEALGLNGEDEA